MKRDIRDITQIDEKDIPQFDICWLSMSGIQFAGKRMGFNDDYKGKSRGTLFSM